MSIVLAKRFIEYIVGEDDVNVDLYSSRDRRQAWLSRYLDARNELLGDRSREVGPEDVETIYLQVDKFDLVCYR
jgi:hypothetical protein